MTRDRLAPGISRGERRILDDLAQLTIEPLHSGYKTSVARLVTTGPILHR